MKPGDHPEFFRLPPPAGTSRESSIVLDGNGRFWHDGALVENARMARAFSKWIARHPDDGRYILCNEYDYVYFEVEDVPFLVEAVVVSGVPGAFEVTLTLSDGTKEHLEPAGMRIGPQEALYVRVKAGAFEARFTQSAQTSLAPVLVEGCTPEEVGLQLRDSVYWLPLRSPEESAKRGP